MYLDTNGSPHDYPTDEELGLEPNDDGEWWGLLIGGALGAVITAAIVYGVWWVMA